MSNSSLRRLFTSAGALLIFGPLLCAAGDPKKKLIEFGWDEPGTAFMKDHAAEMERTPFDGCVFHVDYIGTNGGGGSFTWQAWGSREFARAELAKASQELKSAHLKRFTENFLRFNTTPAKLDWFDDHSAVLANARLAAEFARETKCRGLLFDIEQYEGELFDYRKQRDRQTKSWELYADKARQRGREVMDAFQAGFPNLTIFLTFGYSLPWAESQQGKKALAECHYGLLAPFLDGMLERATGKTLFVDGCELAYGWKEPERFAKGYQMMQSDLLPIVARPDLYKRFFSFGFGLWIDNQWRKLAWDTENFSKNYFTPEAFGASVQHALQRSDRYVWIYSETPRWWSKEGTPVKLPNPYQEAVRKAAGK